MASDFTKGNGGGWSGKARGAAISRLITRKLGVKTVTSQSRGMYGIRVQQENLAGASSYVTVRVWMGEDSWDLKEAVSLAKQVVEAVQDAGYEVTPVNATSFTVTSAAWKFADTVAIKMFGIAPEVMESDSGLVTARPLVVQQLRDNGWIKPDTLELTELGQQVRNHLVAKRRTKVFADKRRLKQRGW